MSKEFPAIIVSVVLLVSLSTAFAPRGLPQAAPDTSPAMPVRAVWMHPGAFGTERTAAVEKIRQTLDEYRLAGIKTLIMLVKDTDGYVYYKSDLAVAAPGYDWDFFGAFLAEARRRQMEVHPWFCVFPEYAIVGQVSKHPEWLIAGPRRDFVKVADPALPAVRNYERSLMLEVAERYKTDWIHLDYIRFPNKPSEPYFSFSPETLRLFKADSGIDLNEVKIRDSGYTFWNGWLEWNRDQVTAFVRELKDALQATGRTIKVSAAVFLDADTAKVMIGQDWPAWAREKLVDMLCPMIYTNDLKFFERYSRRAVANGQGRCQVCLGIGIVSSANQNTPEGMIEQMRVGKSVGADGVVFFSGSALTPPFLEKLKAAK